MSDNDVVIVSAVRTAIGAFGGGLKSLPAAKLGAVVLGEAVNRAGIETSALDEVLMGNCIQCPDEGNIARTAALVAGFPVEVPGYTVNKACSSAMQALSIARAQLIAGDSDVVLAAGVESMSNAPYMLKTARWGQRLQHGEMTDCVWEALHAGSGYYGEKMIMGLTAEVLADKYDITREEQDEVALRSHNNAEVAINNGRFKDEIVPVTIKSRKGEKVIDTDEHPRLGLTMEALQSLKPMYKPDGSVTPGNASGLNDGAAAVVVTTRARAWELGAKPLARIVSQSTAGVPPEEMGYGPVPATEKLLERTGMRIADIGLVEINEAFAAQYIACERGLGLDRDRVNVNGSGIGLGHPVGCTGVRLVVSLLHEMQRRGEQFGLASLCAGGGMGTSVLIELEG